MMQEIRKQGAPLAQLLHAYNERLGAAQQAQRAGMPVVAYVGHTVPVELILAAGCFALQITGDAQADTPLAQQFLDDDFDGDLASVFDRIVSGQFNFVDLIVVPRSSNCLLHLYYFLQEARRMLPQQHFPEVVLYDVLHTPFFLTGDYVLARTADLRQRLERLSARSISESALRTAISGMNANRRALQSLNKLRRRAAPVLSGSDTLCVLGAAHFMAREAHTALTQALVAQAEHAAPLAGVRLMVKGASQDSCAFYALVESLGAVIVADDHITGEPGIAHLVDESLEPLPALAQHYQLHVPTVRSFPQATQDQAFLQRVKDAAVEGVIFFHDEFDDTLGWDYPDQKKMLDAQGIPSAFLQQQSYRTPDRAAQAAAVADLIARSRP